MKDQPAANDNAPSFADTIFPRNMRAREQALIRKRRAFAPAPPELAAGSGRHEPIAIGVGLSGGGIRSATFCLGVFQSLARNRLLKRIDYVSSVSGGGYFGSFLGRLFTRPNNSDDVQRAEHVEKVLSGETEHGVLHALRSNGRYIAPSGGGDVLLLAAVLLRNWVAVLCVVVLTLLAAFAWMETLRATAALLPFTMDIELALNRPDSLSASHIYWSALLVLLPVPLGVCALSLGLAYWVPRSRPTTGFLLTLGACLVAGVAFYFQVLPGVFAAGFSAVLLAMSTLFLTLAKRQVTQLAAQAGPATSDLQADSKVREFLSRRFSTLLWWCVMALAVGLLDSIGRTLYAMIKLGQLEQWSTWLFAGVSSLFGGGFAARRFAVLFAKRPSESRVSIPTTLLATVAALFVGLFLLVVTSASAQAFTWHFTTPPGTEALKAREHKTVSWLSQTTDGHTLELRESLPQPASASPKHSPPLGVESGDRAQHSLRACAWALGLTFLAWLLGSSRNFLLLSSHHPIYSARLTRAYLGASNPRRMQGRNNMTAVMPGDDIALSDYYPKDELDADCAIAHGAPLHFINVTVNETVDGETKLQQQDRRGVGLSLGPCGLSLGARHHSMFWWRDVDLDNRGLAPANAAHESGDNPVLSGHQVFKQLGEHKPEPLSLGRWISLSGAAFSTGIGSRTSLSLSVLTGIFNIRLGHWWDPGLLKNNKLSDGFIVQRYLAREILARFPGTAERLWYLSDGGHFENMGGYELIRRQLRKMVIIDAEADPDYTFAGLSDLVRKARLDFRTEIKFLDDHQLDKLIAPGSRELFGTLAELRRLDSSGLPDRTRHSRACAALARVSYHGVSHPEDGVLLYIKPALIGDESADVHQYHAEHADFPQESTADQFFDEAQWESYRKLGAHIAEGLFAAQTTGEGFVPRDLLDWATVMSWAALDSSTSIEPSAVRYVTLAGGR